MQLFQQNNCKTRLNFSYYILGNNIPIYPLQRVFYTQNLACTPKNDEVLYMLLYIEGTKIRNKTKCTPSFKMQWEPWVMGNLVKVYKFLRNLPSCLDLQLFSPEYICL